MIVLLRTLPTYRERVALSYPRLLASVFEITRAEPVLRWRAVYGAVSFAGFSVLWTTLAFLLSGRPYGYGAGTIGLFGLVGAAGAATAMLAGRFSDRGWKNPLTGLASLLLLVAYLFIWRGATSLAALLVGIVVLDIGAQALHITNQGEIYRLRPEARSRINAFYMMACFIGAAAGSSNGRLRLRGGRLARGQPARRGLRAGLVRLVGARPRDGAPTPFLECGGDVPRVTGGPDGRGQVARQAHEPRRRAPSALPPLSGGL
jgi:predicted MFS family arabinose efflux permease